MDGVLLQTRNALLAGLPCVDYARLSPHLERVALTRGQTIYECNVNQTYAYFPIDCVVSLLYVLRNGASDEIAMIGNEGMVGLALLMGGNHMPSRAVARGNGYALRIAAGRLRDAFQRAPALQAAVLRYFQAIVIQIAQTAVCNRHHTVDQQLSRWLLMSLDRLSSNELSMTHEQISAMLGVRREGITEAAGKLQRARAIQYSRGHIEVIDRCQLEQRACECYEVISRECTRLLQPAIPASRVGTMEAVRPWQTAELNLSDA